MTETPYKITCDIDADLYEAYRAYLAKKNMRTRGNGAEIRHENSRLLTNAIIEEMKKK